MHKLSDVINKLILDTWGGLIAFWALMTGILYKFFCFLGGCMAEGAAEKGAARVTPKVIQEVKKEIAPLKKDIQILKKSFPAYQMEKHTAEGENLYFAEAILSGDTEVLNEIRQLLIKRRDEKK